MSCDDQVVGEYDDALLYDAENARRESDATFYVLLAEEIGGPVLDLGCGTGLVTVPLARAGFDVTGLDLTPTMLARAREKAADTDVTWVEGDVRSFQLGRRFKLIIDTGPVLQHLLEDADQEAMLARVREHLAHDARFVVKVWFARPPDHTEESAEEDWYSYTDETGRAVQVRGTWQYDLARRVFTETAIRSWQAPDGTRMIRRSPLTQRYFPPQELEALLVANGFEVVARYGANDRSPLTSTSSTIIYVCAGRNAS